jgi:hypothetical protein
MLRQFKFNLFSSSSLSRGAFAPPARGNPKGARPFSKRVSLHVVLKSSRARGAHSLLKRERGVRGVLERQAARFGVQLQGVANVGNHLHLLLRAPAREQLANFLRAVTGLIARLILQGNDAPARCLGTEARKPSNARSEVALSNANRFWDTRPFSRLVSNGRDWCGVRDYIAMNQIESLGASREIAREVMQRRREAMPAGPGSSERPMDQMDYLI